MADNVPITAGTGTNISTDDAGAGGHVQRMKLCYSADGDETHIGADANGLDVDVTRLPALPAGNNNIGDVDVVSLPTGYAKTADLDSGAGTDTVVLQGIALPASGGAVAGGSSTNPVRTDPTGTTTQPVSGTVSVNALPSGTNNIGDVDVLTVPADQTVKLRGTHANTISSRITGLQSNPVLDVRMVEDSLGNALGQTATYPVYQTPSPMISGVFSFVTSELTMATATGTKEILTIFHASSVTESLYVLELRWLPTGTPITAGRAVFELQYITAENGTPGGTSITPQGLNRGNSLPANINLRSVVTGAPTTTGQVFERRPLIYFPNVTGTMPGQSQPPFEDGHRLWDSRIQGALVMRGSNGEGIRLTLNILATLTGAQTGHISGTMVVV